MGSDENMKLCNVAIDEKFILEDLCNSVSSINTNLCILYCRNREVKWFGPPGEALKLQIGYVLDDPEFSQVFVQSIDGSHHYPET